MPTTNYSHSREWQVGRGYVAVAIKNQRHGQVHPSTGLAVALRGGASSRVRARVQLLTALHINIHSNTGIVLQLFNYVRYVYIGYIVTTVTAVNYVLLAFAETSCNWLLTEQKIW